MVETKTVRPRHGLILAGIPRAGAAIPRDLADQWIADQLVEPVDTKPTAVPAIRPEKQGRRK